MTLKRIIDMNFSLRMALPFAAAMLLSPLALAQTMSPQTAPAQSPAAATPAQTMSPQTPPAVSSPAAATPLTQTFSTDQRHEIEGIIKDYLVQHPGVLQDAMDALDKQQKQADADKARVTIKDNNATIFNSPHQVVLGNPQGNVTMVEFFDYNCAFCKRALPDMMSLLKTDPDLRFVLKEFPVLGPGSVEAAHVAVAARMQDPTGKKYIEFHQKLLGSRGSADKERALAVAKEVGFDMTRLAKDMDSDEVKQTIEENMKLADALGVNGTPSYVVGDEVVVGAVGIDALKDKIKAERK
jgi:protein-disulfide isomerase